MKRRAFVKSGLAAGAAAFVPASACSAASDPAQRVAVSSRVNHSVCKWCYPDFTVEELAAAAKEIGLVSIELLDPGDWPALAKHDLLCAMSNPPPAPEGMSFLTHGFNRPEHHPWLVEGYERALGANCSTPPNGVYSGEISDRVTDGSCVWVEYWEGGLATWIQQYECTTGGWSCWSKFKSSIPTIPRPTSRPPAATSSQ